MLGRIPRAATVAALPWAGVLVAATAGSVLWIVLGSLATMAILLWGLAPRIPGLRNLLPAVRHVSRLEDFWVEGHELASEWFQERDEFARWLKRQKKWHRQTGDWIESHVSKVEAERFRRPEVTGVSPPFVFNETHRIRVNVMNSGLTELIRLRDELESSLR